MSKTTVVAVGVAVRNKAKDVFRRMSDRDLSDWWAQYGANGQAAWYRDAPRRAALREMRYRGFSVSGKFTYLRPCTYPRYWGLGGSL